MPLDFPSSPSTGDEYLDWTWDGTKWKVTSGVGGAAIYVSTTAPVDPELGNLWWDPNVGRLYIWDGGAGQEWVGVSAPAAGPPGPQGPTGPAGSIIPDAPSDGELYGRQNGAWEVMQGDYLPLAGGTLTNPGNLIVTDTSASGVSVGINKATAGRALSITKSGANQAVYISNSSTAAGMLISDNGSGSGYYLNLNGPGANLTGAGLNVTVQAGADTHPNYTGAYLNTMRSGGYGLDIGGAWTDGVRSAAPINPVGGIRGVTDGSSAAPGMVGELIGIENYYANVNLTGSYQVDLVAQIVIPLGDWDVQASVVCSVPVNQVAMLGISMGTNSSPFYGPQGLQAAGTSANTTGLTYSPAYPTMVTPTFRVSPNPTLFPSGQTWYLYITGHWTGANPVQRIGYRINARRMR